MLVSRSKRVLLQRSLLVVAVLGASSALAQNAPTHRADYTCPDGHPDSEHINGTCGGALNAGSNRASTTNTPVQPLTRSQRAAQVLQGAAQGLNSAAQQQLLLRRLQKAEEEEPTDDQEQAKRQLRDDESAKRRQAEQYEMQRQERLRQRRLADERRQQELSQQRAADQQRLAAQQEARRLQALEDQKRRQLEELKAKEKEQQYRASLSNPWASPSEAQKLKSNPFD